MLFGFFGVKVCILYFCLFRKLLTVFFTIVAYCLVQSHACPGTFDDTETQYPSQIMIKTFKIVTMSFMNYRRIDSLLQSL